MNTRACRLALLGLVLSLPLNRAGAAFVNGHVYISAAHHQINGGLPRIYDFDPATGQSTIFTHVGGAYAPYAPSDLVFTPDNSRLRAVSFNGSSLLDFDPGGDYEVAWGPGDGVNAPARGTFSPAGDYWLSQLGVQHPAILRFPGGAGPPQVFAEYGDPNYPFLNDFGAVTVDSADNVFFAKGENLYRIRPSGEATHHVSLPSPVASMKMDSGDNLYAWTNAGLFRISPGMSDAELVSGIGAASYGDLCLDPAGAYAFGVRGDFVYRIDLITGQYSIAGENPAQYPYIPLGAALYVPEPATIMMLALASLLTAIRRSR